MLRNRRGATVLLGRTTDGELGLGDDELRIEPTRVGDDSDWMDVALAEGTSCGVRNGELYCWGSNRSSLLGLDSEDASMVRAAPTRVDERDDWRRIWAGTTSFCASDVNDDVWCWGDNTWGNLGLGYAGEPVASPTLVVEQGWDELSIADDASCGLKADHTAWCWVRTKTARWGVSRAGPMCQSSRNGLRHKKWWNR